MFKMFNNITNYNEKKQCGKKSAREKDKIIEIKNAISQKMLQQMD